MAVLRRVNLQRNIHDLTALRGGGGGWGVASLRGFSYKKIMGISPAQKNACVKKVAILTSY